MSDGIHFITVPRHNPLNAITMGGIVKDFWPYARSVQRATLTPESDKASFLIFPSSFCLYLVRRFPSPSAFQCNRFSAKLAKNRVQLVDSPHPYGQVASVAILRIGAILLDV